MMISAAFGYCMHPRFATATENKEIDDPTQCIPCRSLDLIATRFRSTGTGGRQLQLGNPAEPANST